MPLYIQKQNIDNLSLKEERKADCYIVSKCYVVSEEKRFDCFGNYQMFYKVVFPYKQEYGVQKDECFLKRQEPIFDKYGECINSVSTKYVYTTYDEAKKQVSEANKLSYFTSGEQEVIKNFQSNCLELEKDIALGTGYLKPNFPIKKHEVIMEYNYDAYIQSFSIYDYIESSFDKKNDFPAIVYTVPKSDLNKMREEALVYQNIPEDLKKKCQLLFINEDDSGIKIYNSSKFKYDGYYHLLKDSVYFVDEKIKMPTEKELRDYVKFYTTETCSDLLNSYFNNYIMGYSDFSDAKALNSVKKKVLKLNI